MSDINIPMLSIKGVSKQYDQKLALDHINLNIPQSGIFGLLGPNGAGKTSLIRIITQITAPDTGEILFKNEILSPAHIAKMGYLPEERGLYKKMEVGEQMIYLAQLKGLSRKDAIARCKIWIEKFDIKDWWKKKIEELSKGMQQKVQFITTIIHEPELIILDEPFTGFDPINAALVRDEMIRLRNEGHTILFSTHRMESVEELCDSIALIHHSRKILDGSVREIREGFRKNEFRIEHKGAISDQPGLFSIERSKSMPEGRTETFLILEKSATAKQLILALVEKIDLLAFEEHLPGINEIFIEVVSRKE